MFITNVLSLLLCIWVFVAAEISTDPGAVWFYIAGQHQCVNKYAACGGKQFFKTAQECNQACMTGPCGEPPFSGSVEGDDSAIGCSSSIKHYTYLAEYNVCVRNNNAGCSGNANRFKTLEECENKCRKPSKHNYYK